MAARRAAKSAITKPSLSNNGALKVIPWHYNVITGSFLFIGAMYSLRKLADRVRPRCGGQPEVVLAVVLILAGSGGLYWRLGSGFLPEMDEGAFVLDPADAERAGAPLPDADASASCQPSV